MTLSELRNHGYPRGDEELAARYRELIGAEEAFAPGLDPKWQRGVMFELVAGAARGPLHARRRRALLKRLER